MSHDTQNLEGETTEEMSADSSEHQGWGHVLQLSPEDEALLNGRGETDEGRLLLEAARALHQLAEESPAYGLHDGPQLGEYKAERGRFSFFSYAESAAKYYGLLRLCRELLDFLESDLDTCVESEIIFWERQAREAAEHRAQYRAGEQGAWQAGRVQL